MIRWLQDWRTIAALSGAVLVGLLAVLVITSVSDREAALQVARRATANEQAERAVLNHRIDQLLVQIGRLEGDAEGNATQLAVLRREVTLLQQQVRDLGGQPVIVAAGGGASPAPRSSASPTVRPTSRPTPRPTRTPSPSPTPTCLLIICR